MRKINLLLFFILVCTLSLPAQNNLIKPAILGQKFPDFSLLTYQGYELSMQSLRGKNVLFIVSRGKYADDKWCTICHYQYAEWADWVLSKQIREKYNLEVVFLLPYSKDSIISWEKAFPREMEKIEKWKNPDNPDNLNPKQKEWMEFARENYPQKFDFKDKKVPLPLPVWIDDKQEVSKGLDLYRTEWDKATTSQNIPAVFIIDKEGILRFKYISQNTKDRPTAKYILTFIEKML